MSLLFNSRFDADDDDFFFLERFLGDQRASYNQDLTFTLRIAENEPAPTARDVILEGGNGEQLTQPIFGQTNQLPNTSVRFQGQLTLRT